MTLNKVSKIPILYSTQENYNKNLITIFNNFKETKEMLTGYDNNPKLFNFNIEPVTDEQGKITYKGYIRADTDTVSNIFTDIKLAST